MHTQEPDRWLAHSESATSLLLHLTQPLTVGQLAHRARITSDACTQLLRKLARRGLVHCLTPKRRQSRVYVRTTNAQQTQDLQATDWNLYGWVCFRHRAAVLTALTEPLQPAAIKRRARFHNDKLRMSANNVRDVIRLFKEKNLVRTIQVRGKAHPRYKLTPLGHQLQALLMSAQSPAR